MKLEQDDIRGLLTPFIAALKSPDDFTEQSLFDGREALKLVFDRTNTTAKRSQAQAFWSIQAMVGSLIRKGSVDQQIALSAIGDLLESLVEWAETAPGGKTAFTLAPPLGGEVPEAKRYLKLANGPLEAAPESSQQSLAGPAPSPFVPTHENCLGQLLVHSGKLSNESLSRALTLQKINGRRLGEVLIAMEAVGIQTLEEALVRQKFLKSCNSTLPQPDSAPRLRLDQ